MASRYTAAEKGKGPLIEPPANVKRIKAPRLDTTALIKDNSLTLIGRLTNPKEQRVWALIPALSRKWNLQGSAEGSDLGNNCFQFRFEREDDLNKVLANRPYHFAYWMVIIQKWEPIISPTFPSMIPFWIRIKGLPLHYWHEDMVHRIGREIGSFEKLELTRASAKVRVLVDGLKPLIKHSIVEFDTGEEAHISLEYERLENHCSICYSLLHLKHDCSLTSTEGLVPLATNNKEGGLGPATRQTNLTSAYPRYTTLPDEARNDPLQQTEDPTLSLRNNKEMKKDYPTDTFKERVDRHGRSFGSRVSTKQTRNPPPEYYRPPTKNSSSLSWARRHEPEKSPSFASPPFVTNRDHPREAHSQGRVLFPTKELQRQWRPIQQVRQTNEPQKTATEDLMPQAKQLTIIPTRETVMEELHEATRQYLSCSDPVEAAARRQRVQYGDAQGDMEKAADAIIAAAINNHGSPVVLPSEDDNPATPPPLADIHPQGPIFPEPPVPINPIPVPSQEDDGSHEATEVFTPTNEATTKKKRGRPVKLKSTIITPDIIRGTSSKKRNLSRLQNSPGRAHASPGESTSRKRAKKTQKQGEAATNSSQAGPSRPPIQLIPAISKRSSDFRVPRLPAP